MKLSLSREAREARKRKVVNVVSAQSKQDEARNLSSDLSLELSEAKSEILRLKHELVNQQIKISNNFKAMNEEEIRALKSLFEEEKRCLINRLSKEHSQRILEINKEHEQTLKKSILQEINKHKQTLKQSILQAIDAPTDKPKFRNGNQSKYNSDDNLIELDHQYDRDNGLLDPAPYDPEYEW